MRPLAEDEISKSSFYSWKTPPKEVEKDNVKPEIIYQRLPFTTDDIIAQINEKLQERNLNKIIT